MKSISIINGPNLNLLGQREPEIYGSGTIDDIEKVCMAKALELDFKISMAQSNVEGEIVNLIHSAINKHDGIIINAGAYTHTSISIMDAIAAVKIPTVEVHISNLYQPKQVGAVQTCRGSHTHSVVSGPGPEGKIIVYNSGTASVRDEEELESCIGNVPGDSRTALFRIDIIEIPVSDPSLSRIVSSPAVFADPETGALGGLWAGGDHGEETQDTRRTDQCHDITVFPSGNIAAGACLSLIHI